MRQFRVIAGNRDLAIVEAVWGLVSVVRWATAILVALYAYEESGATSVGVVALVRMLPAALAAPRLAMLADHLSGRRVLLVSLGARFLLLAAMATVVATERSLLLLVVLGATYGVAESVQRPVQASLIGVHARNPTELAAANTVWSVLDNVAFVGGSVLVGALVAVGGDTVAWLACVGVLTLAIVPAPALARDAALPPIAADRHRWALLAGVRTVLHRPKLRLLVGLASVDFFVQAILDVLLVVAAIDLLDLGRQGAGWLSAGWGVGGVIGGIAAGWLFSRRLMVFGMVAALVLAGVPMLVLGGVAGPATAITLMGVAGIGFGTAEVALLTFTQRLTPTDVLGRVFGAQETLSTIAMAVGSLAASGLLLVTDTRGALIATGAVLPLVGILCTPGILRLRAADQVPGEVVQLLRGVDALAMLPMAVVETLALRCRLERVSPGHEVVRQGDRGDAFYVIKEGRVRVTDNGRRRREQGPGEFFGEIALLREVPRTATVTAIEPTDLVALHRDDFLPAVGTHARASHLLDAVASERIG